MQKQSIAMVIIEDMVTRQIPRIDLFVIYHCLCLPTNDNRLNAQTYLN